VLQKGGKDVDSKLNAAAAAALLVILCAAQAHAAGEAPCDPMAEGVLLAAAPLAATPAPTGSAGERWTLLGPLRSHDLTPFGLHQLQMLPPPAVFPCPGRWAIEAELDYSNTFALSDTVSRYLAERQGGRRAPITAADVDALLAQPGDLYYVDGEFGMLNLTAHYSLTDRWGVYLAVPLYYYSGGFLDSFIESFHGSFGFGTAERNLVTQNRFDVIYRLHGSRVVQLGAPSGGAGDPVVGAHYSLRPDGAPWDVLLEAALKVPVGGERAFLSNGQTDFGVQISLRRKFVRQAIYFSLGAVHLGGPPTGLDPGRQTLPSYSMAYEFAITHHTGAAVQLNWSPSAVQHSQLVGILDPRVEVLLGLRNERGRWVYSLASTENLFYFRNTPDIGFELGVAYKLGRSF
jgi:hypothetical protein